MIQRVKSIHIPTGYCFKQFLIGHSFIVHHLNYNSGQKYTYYITIRLNVEFSLLNKIKEDCWGKIKNIFLSTMYCRKQFVQTFDGFSDFLTPLFLHCCEALIFSGTMLKSGFSQVGLLFWYKHKKASNFGCFRVLFRIQSL